MTTERTTNGKDGARQLGALAPLRVVAYRRVWLAMVVSHLGTYLHLTAGPWLMLRMTGSPFMVSLVTAVLFLPRLLLTIPAGAMSDRFDRRTIMMVVQAVSGASVGALAVVVLTDRLTPAILLVLTGSLGISTAMEKPSYQTLIPDLVPSSLRAQAITLKAASHQLARVIGPSMGGLFVATGLEGIAFAGNALSFLVVMAVLGTVPGDRQAGDRGDRGPREGGRVLDGFRYARAQRGLRLVLLVAAMFTLTAAGLQTLLPNIADDLGLGAWGFGLLYGIFGGGALIGTVLRQRLADRAGPRLLPSSIVLFGSICVVIGLTSSPVVAGTAMVLAGFGWIWTMTTLNVTVQFLAPRAVRGRVVAVFLLAISMKPIGALVVGALAEVTGAGMAVAIASLATVALGSVAFWMRLPAPVAEIDPVPADAETP